MCIYMYIYAKKTFKSTAKIPCGAISVHTSTLSQMHVSSHMMQDIKYGKQVSFPLTAFAFL